MNLLIFIIFVLGHLAIVRASMNRVYELGLNHQRWLLAFSFHVLFAVGVPIAMYYFVGRHGARVLRGGDWNDVHALWLAYFTLCVVALLAHFWLLGWRRLSAPVDAQLAVESTVCVPTDAIARVPRGRGLIGLLARLPRNEIFSIDFVERQLHFANLPGAVDGLSIIHLTDMHMHSTPDEAFFEWALERCVDEHPDLVALTGDIVDRFEALEWLPRTLGLLPRAASIGCHFVLGNHDVDVGPDRIRKALVDIGWSHVGGQIIDTNFREHPLRIAGTELPWFGEAPALVGQPRNENTPFSILLSHAPHLARWADRRGVDLMLAGHLHGGQIQWPLIGPVSGGRFHSGLFRVGNTIMNVGRGVGQLAPIRYRCRPEITKIILRTKPL